MLLSVKTQLTSDNKFFKYITSKYLSSKSEVLILSLSKIGYKDWRIGGLSCNVDEDEDEDVDVDVDVDKGVDFDKLDGIYLQLSGIDTRPFSDQLIDSIISVDIELRKSLLHRRMIINGGRTWLLYCVVGFLYEDDDLVPIRMNTIFFPVIFLSIIRVNLEVDISWC